MVVEKEDIRNLVQIKLGFSQTVQNLVHHS